LLHRRATNHSELPSGAQRSDHHKLLYEQAAAYDLITAPKDPNSMNSIFLSRACLVTCLLCGYAAAAPATLRIGLAALERGPNVRASVAKIEKTLAECAGKKVDIVCFPETYLPGLRGAGNDASLPPPNQPAMEQALADIRGACRQHRVAAIVGMEWVSPRGLENRAFVIDAEGTLLGHQTKDQITPGGEARNYVPEGTRRMFEIKGVPFGVVICHEGWRYPETVRWAAVRGAKIVFQPQVTGSDQSRPARPQNWGDSYYEKAMILRSKENSIYFASVNETMRRQNSATSLIDPDGNLVAHIPYGEEGLLVAELDLSKATGLYASRYRPEFYPQDDRPAVSRGDAVGQTESAR
jgi:predicted amidohydrolase